MCEDLIELYGFSLCIPPLVWKPAITAKMICDQLAQNPNICTDALGLDMGCGCGIFALQLARLGAKTVLAVDLNEAAVKASQANWVRNQFPITSLVPILSNGFKNVPLIYRGKLNLIISNPPTQPAKYAAIHAPQRNQDYHWNEAGHDGRAILDSLIDDGLHWLKSQGQLIFSVSSRHGWKQTHERLDYLFQLGLIAQWQILDEAILPLEDFQQEYLDFWLTKHSSSDDLRIFLKDGRYYHHLRVISVTKK